MKILFVMNSFMTPSGAEHVLADFLKSADEVEPFFLHIGHRRPDLIRLHEIADDDHFYYVHCSKLLISPYSRQWFMKLFRKIVCHRLKEEKVVASLRKDSSIDLVYFNNSFEAAVFFPLFQDRKTLIHIHDMVEMFRPAQKKCVLKACQNGNCILTPSKACKEMLVRNGISESKISVAYNSIDLPARPFRWISNNSISVGFVGSCIKRKGFDTYISILNGLDERIGEKKQIKAVIITNSNPKNTFIEKNIRRLNKSIAVELYSGLSRENVFQKYREMDFLLVPSRFDPLPTIVLEATLCGLSVFGSNTDGIPEMLCDKRLLFAKDDIDDAVGKITNWLSTHFDEKLSVIKKVQDHIEKTFTKENKQDCVLRTIRKALEN